MVNTRPKQLELLISGVLLRVERQNAVGTRFTPNNGQARNTFPVALSLESNPALSPFLQHLSHLPAAVSKIINPSGMASAEPAKGCMVFFVQEYEEESSM